jgi:hypothetical protein
MREYPPQQVPHRGNQRSLVSNGNPTNSVAGSKSFGFIAPGFVPHLLNQHMLKKAEVMRAPEALSLRTSAPVL